MKIIDAVGKNCPIPVLCAKKECDAGEKIFAIKVDNNTACQNLSRFAESQGGSAKIENDGANFLVSIILDGSAVATTTQPVATIAVPESGKYAIFCGNNTLGQGDLELGANLITMFFYTLGESGRLPSHICFVNNGVKLTAENEQVIEHLNAMAEKGVKIFVCGACLNYYGLTPKAGQVSNMYDILTALQDSPKVVTI